MPESLVYEELLDRLTDESIKLVENRLIVLIQPVKQAIDIAIMLFIYFL